MYYAKVLSLTGLFVGVLSVPVADKRDMTMDRLTQLAVDHPELKADVEAVIQAEYAGIRPAKRDETKATLTRLAIDHPEVKDAVEAVIQAEYAGIRPARRDFE
ncbi:hypothetical protein K4F52_002881 [Lecanicillium sp. MT-2017a]|nr:hypothetical protein K4F52_002881 [Lecanicillium sp. MT-2017a]